MSNNLLIKESNPFCFTFQQLRCCSHFSKPSNPGKKKNQQKQLHKNHLGSSFHCSTKPPSLCQNTIHCEFTQADVKIWLEGGFQRSRNVIVFCLVSRWCGASPSHCVGFDFYLYLFNPFSLLNHVDILQMLQMHIIHHSVCISINCCWHSTKTGYINILHHNSGMTGAGDSVDSMLALIAWQSRSM